MDDLHNHRAETPCKITDQRGQIAFEQRNIKGAANKFWHRGEHCNFNPYLKNLLEGDAIERYVLYGWLPSQPLISKTTKIAAFGSCFADEILKYLAKTGYNAKSRCCLEAGVNTTFAIKDALDWAYNDKRFYGETWHREDKSLTKRDKKTKKQLLETLNSSEFFIITLGLSEIWSNKETKEVYWRAIPDDLFDENIHEFRISSVQENKENIKYIYDIIIKNNPTATVLFTISPVSLVATFRPISCISANSVSKSILRAAIDEFCRELDIHNNNQLYYWPSYEIVDKMFQVTIKNGPYKADNRHIKPQCVNRIMELFDKYYLIK